MRFLADMGVSQRGPLARNRASLRASRRLHGEAPQRVTAHLTARGYDVEHLCDIGLHRLPDALIFERAIRDRRVVLAFDLDFGEIAARCRGPWASVIVFRLADTTSGHVASRLDAALDAAGSEIEMGAVVVVVEESRVRIRRLPIHRSE